MTDQNFTNFLINKIKNDKGFAGEFLKVSLEEYSENANKEELLLALRRIAEAKGISELQKKSGIARNVFYRSLSPKGNPTIDTLLAILKSLNLKMVFKPV